MTLQIRSSDTIAGIPIKTVRSFFRHLVSWHRHSFELPLLQEHLSLDKKSALALVAELENQNYLKPLGNGAYEFTDKGEELVRASAAGKISRKTAEEALAGLLERGPTGVAPAFYDPEHNECPYPSHDKGQTCRKQRCCAEGLVSGDLRGTTRVFSKKQDSTNGS